MKKGITFFVLIFWMAVIFYFSAQTGGKSSDISQSVGYRIAESISNCFHQDKTTEELSQQAEQMQLVIRKGAHMTEYAILAIFTLLHICCYRGKPKKFWWWSWGFCILYAATDEIHQLFVPGREGRFLDVCIDSIGSLIGILLFMLVYAKCLKRKETR